MGEHSGASALAAETFERTERAYLFRAVRYLIWAVIVTVTVALGATLSIGVILLVASTDSGTPLDTVTISPSVTPVG